MRTWVTATLLAVTLTPVFASPAGSCSCAPITDVVASVGESQAAFVGTLVATRDGGIGDFGEESIHVFEVEAWVKGSGGDVIEVRSVTNGAACGLEFWDPDQRVGALLHEVNGELHAGLCDQIDPDVLLATISDPTPSSTGIGHILVGLGWASADLTVLDEAGHHVTDLSPPGEAPDWTGTQLLTSCPGGSLVVQMTESAAHVWDMTSLEVVASHDLSALPSDLWAHDISCRDPEASSIYVLVGQEQDGLLFEIVPEVEEVIAVPGSPGGIGTDFVVTSSVFDGAVNRVDLATGESAVLVDNPPPELRSLMVSVHPGGQLVAVLDTLPGLGIRPDESNLRILDGTGHESVSFQAPEGSFQPVWLDDTRLLVVSWGAEAEKPTGTVFDTATGETSVIDGWHSEHATIAGDTLYGASGGTIVTADVATGEMADLVTLPFQSVGPLLVLEAGPIAPAPGTVPEPAPTQPTTPPLVAPGVPGETDGEGPALQWIAGVAIATFLAVLVWLSARPSSRADEAGSDG